MNGAVLVGNKGRAFILEDLPAGHVVPMFVRIDHVLDRLIGHFRDFLTVHFSGFRTDGVGCDHAIVSDHKNIAGIAIAERIKPRGDFFRVIAVQIEHVPTGVRRRFRQLFPARRLLPDGKGRRHQEDKPGNEVLDWGIHGAALSLTLASLKRCDDITMLLQETQMVKPRPLNWPGKVYGRFLAGVFISSLVALPFVPSEPYAADEETTIRIALGGLPTREGEPVPDFANADHYRCFGDL